MYFPRDEYEERWTRALAEMRRRGYTAAVVWQRSGGSHDRATAVHWLTNYAALSSGQEPRFAGRGEIGEKSHAAVILREGAAPELHINEALENTDLGEIAAGEIFFDPQLVIGLASRMKELGIEGRVAYYGDDFLPALFYRTLLKETPAIQWIPEDELLIRAQMIKSPRELNLYREAGIVASRALTAVMESLISGAPESEAAALGAAELIRAGGGFHRVCMHHGHKSDSVMWSDSYYGYTTDATKSGELVRAWVYGPILEGYWMDPGRSAVCGRNPSSAQRHLIEDCISIVQRVVDLVRPGATPRAVGKAADEVARKVGYYDTDQGAGIWDHYGHGVGPYWMPPIVPANYPDDFIDPGWLFLDEPYQAGMVCTSEAFLNHPGVGTASFERNFIIGPEGIELLDTTPMTF